MSADPNPVVFRYLLNRFRKSLKAFPEAICCPMHSEFLEIPFKGGGGNKRAKNLGFSPDFSG